MKRRTIITSVLVIVLCLGLISGSTFALFTSESKVNIAVTSGKVSITASLDGLKLYSADATLTEGDKVDKINPLDKTGEILSTDSQGTFAGVYRYKSMPVENNEGTFANGGTAAIVESTATTPQSLSIQRITPGDKVALDVKIANGSNVDIQYRVKVNVLSGLKLYEALVVKVDGLSLQGVQKVSNWTYVEAPTTTEAVIATIPVEVYLPLDVSDATLQDLATSMQITVEAVQGNAKTTNEVLAQVVTAAKTVAEGNSDTVISDDDGLVEVTVPKAAIKDSSLTTIALKVTPQDTVSAINITSLQDTLSYDVKILETTTSTTSAIKEDNDAEITVRMFIGTGLKGVELYHNTTPIPFTYDETTGYIEFTTNSFSEYTVVYNKDVYVENVSESTITKYTAQEDAGVYEDEQGNTVVVTKDETTNEVVVSSDSGVAYVVKTSGKVFYDTLQEAIDAAKSGETVGLLKSVTISTDPKTGLTKYAATIDKSLTLNGNGNTITAGTDRVLCIVGESKIDVTLNDVTLKCSANAGAQGIWTGDYLDHLTLNNVIIDNRAAQDGNVQAMTISYTDKSQEKRNITIKNSKVLNDEDIDYAMIFYAPVNLTLIDSDISGWTNFYFKDSSSGSTTTITGGKLTSVGVAGYSNSFGLVQFENSNSTVTITNADINVSTSAADSTQSIVSFSEWYGPNTGNTVTINGGKITLTGEKARYFIENGQDNKLIINGATINNSATPVDYSYTSPVLSNWVAYMYMGYVNNQLVNKCDGYYDFNSIITASYLENGEWFDFYSDSVVLTDDVEFKLKGNSSGTFGFIIGSSTLTAENDSKITIPAGVTIKTDKAIDGIFAAPEGYTLKVTELNDTTYHYSYTVE